MIQDLHSHTYYSFCGIDSPEQVVETAIAGGIKLLGISDHNYGIGCATTEVFQSASHDIQNNYDRTLRRYYDHMSLIKEKYADRIKILCGIEVGTLKQGRVPLPPNADISFFDYCLIEHLDAGTENTVTSGDLFAFAKRCGCPAGVAHTDLFGYIQAVGADPLAYFTKMAQHHIFWEMNVNLDTIHGGHEHQYMLEFFENKEQQDVIRKSGICLSVGFDGHRVYDYKPERIASYCRRISELGIRLAFSE